MENRQVTQKTSWSALLSFLTGRGLNDVSPLLDSIHLRHQLMILNNISGGDNRLPERSWRSTNTVSLPA